MQRSTNQGQSSFCHTELKMTVSVLKFPFTVTTPKGTKETHGAKLYCHTKLGRVCSTSSDKFEIGGVKFEVKLELLLTRIALVLSVFAVRCRVFGGFKL